MPQATDELRARMNQLFGDPVDDAGPISFLEKRGFVLTSAFEWRLPPGVKTWAELTTDEQNCICFLCDEWDFGGVALDA
jgi:hypothetical protein